MAILTTVLQLVHEFSLGWVAQEQVLSWRTRLLAVLYT